MKPTSGNFSQRSQSELAQLHRDVSRLLDKPGMPAFVTDRLRFAAETLTHLQSAQTRKARPRAPQFATASVTNPRINKFGA